MTADQRIGKRIADYVIEQVIGRGGMGVVYRARAVQDERVVALKLMLPELAANEDFRQRFIDEAEIVPQIDHPNIVPMYGVGEADGELYIAMYLIEGLDLKALITTEGRLPVRRTLSILGQAANALDAAHENGVVHRDVKPQNIMVVPAASRGETDLVFLTDFGLIRPTGSESSTSRTGQVFGSIQYMSPEQIEGLPDDGRGDVYSLACVAYECLTGRIPFDRPNEVGVIWAHIHDDPPRASALAPGLPGGIDDVLRQGMAKHPDDRFLTCGELVTALREGLKKRRAAFAAPLRPIVARARRPKTEREVWSPNFFPELSRVRKASQRIDWLRTSAVVTALAVFVVAFVELAHPRGITGAAVDVASAVDDVGREVQGIFAGDDEKGTDATPPEQGGDTNRRSALAKGPFAGVASPATGDVAVEESASPSSRGPIAAPAPRSNSIVFHVTGRWFEGYSALYTMTSRGSNVRLMYNSNDPDHDAVWSPDGTRIAFVRADRIWVMDADGTDLAQLSARAGQARDPAWSPDGTRIVFAYTPLPTGEWDLHVIRSDGSDAGIGRPLTQASGSERQPAWSPDGSSIAFTKGGGEQQRVLVMEADGSDERELFPSNTGHPTSAPRWSPDGERVAYLSSGEWGHRIEVRQIAGGRAVTIPCRAECGTASWAPDGMKILYVDEGTRSGTWNLYVTPLSRPTVKTMVARRVSADTRGDWR